MQHIMHVPDPRLHKQYGREFCNFDIAVWERDRENMVRVGSFAKFTQNPVMLSHLLGTADRRLAEASPYNLAWSIGCRADNVSARKPPLWSGSNFLGKTLQTVRRLFRDRAPASRATNFCLLREIRGPLETASSKLTLQRDCDCVQVTSQQPPQRRDTPAIDKACHRTTAATSSL